MRDSGSIAIVEAPHRVAATQGASTLRRRLTELMNDGRRQILVELQNAKYADSFGLAELAASFNEAQNRGVTMVFHCPPGRVRELLNVTRLDEVFPIHEDEQAAIAAVQGTGASAEPSGSEEPSLRPSRRQ
ncbi:MAG: STAS domain-containing protein [Acidobacteria bacterium]|nr:STAS domain-containing protein [Acidobacteriota bacterium]NIT10300.1 STAS domain-containing protein [Acidobacteriota bacterium]